MIVILTFCFQLSTGEVIVQFLDGSELAIQSNPMVVRYTAPGGHTDRYSESDQLPPHIREKLEALPTVMSTLEASQVAQASRLQQR